MSVTDSDISTKVDELFPHAVKELSELVAIPSVSWPSFDPTNVHRTAASIKELASSLNIFESVEIVQSQLAGSTQLGQPAVVARRNAKPGYPTVLLYAHHDVQPPGDEELWNTSPFVATEIDGRLYGRGCADDKAGILVHMTALRALNELELLNNVGIVLFVEGEEEYGSPSFDNFIRDHHDLLSADVIIVADSGNWDTETPALTTTLRGNVTFKISLTTLDHALHSGMFGGVVPDAFMALSKLVSSFSNPDGSVAIHGLDVQTSSELKYSEERMRQESGILDGVQLIGQGDVLSRVWSQPSVTVTGIDFPSVANASNTLVPTVSARISVRVAPGQSASAAFDAVENHIEEFTPFGAHADITDVSVGEGFSANTDGWAADLMSQSLSNAFSQPCVNMGVGGSIPFISSFVSEFPQAQVLVTGVEDPDSRAHSPNESLHLVSFKNAILAQSIFLASADSISFDSQE